MNTQSEIYTRLEIVSWKHSRDMRVLARYLCVINALFFNKKYILDIFRTKCDIHVNTRMLNNESMTFYCDGIINLISFFGIIVRKRHLFVIHDL